MNSLVKNRFLDALLKLMLISAIFHMILLSIYSISHLDGSLLNYFGIVALNLYFPTLALGGIKNTLADAAAIGLYILVYVTLTHRPRTS